MIRIAFLCTQNSARSQMAEGFGRELIRQGTRGVEVYSAGTDPSGAVHPLAKRVMEEKGISLDDHVSKSLNDIPVGRLDYVITLCGDAADQCPAVPGARTEHWNLPDPARAGGSEEERLAAFRTIRDEIERRVAALFECLRPVR